MLLEDFNYFINKAINQYINKRYNIYDVNQQTTDDLRVLKAGTLLPVNRIKIDDSFLAINNNPSENLDLKKLFGATYEVNLPPDYMHILNCICIYKMKQSWKCYDKNDIVKFAAKRLTADAWSVVINDYYNRPLPQRPYFYIHNVNTRIDNPTNPLVTNDASDDYEKYKNGTDLYSPYKLKENDNSVVVESSNFNRNIPFKWPDKSTTVVSGVNKETAVRYGNPSNVRMEIRYGDDSSIFELQKVWIDYIKTPQFIRLTQTQVNLTQDTSQIMEFPDYVCQEIINELVTLVMENTADPRLQTNATVTKSIANPVQQQTQQQG